MGYSFESLFEELKNMVYVDLRLMKSVVSNDSGVPFARPPGPVEQIEGGIILRSLNPRDL